ncbi:MAG TPA: DsbA family protein, partial [Rhizomicrobium sp.]|nr:DsbA family protein [Rhizomicrobium sp.]
ALAGEVAGWTPAFTRAVYTANFAEQKDISDDAVLFEILTKIRADAASVTAAANTPDNKARLKAQTDEATKREIFGAPFFMVGDEPFWGNDRLEEAIAFAKR